MSTVSVIATLTVKDGQGDTLVSAFEEFWPSLAAEPGTLSYVLHRSTTNPNQFFVTEQYADQAAFDAHASSDGFAKMGAAMGDAIESFDLQMAEPIKSKDPDVIGAPTR